MKLILVTSATVSDCFQSDSCPYMYVIYAYIYINYTYTYMYVCIPENCYFKATSYYCLLTNKTIVIFWLLILVLIFAVFPSFSILLGNSVYMKAGLHTLSLWTTSSPGTVLTVARNGLLRKGSSSGQCEAVFPKIKTVHPGREYLRQKLNNSK